MKKVMIGIIIGVVVLLSGILIFYNVNISKMSNDDTPISFTIESGTTTNEVLNDLKNNGLIRDVNIVKIYMKLNKVNNIQAGNYILNKTMSVEDLLNALSTGKVIRDEITITFVEGKRIPYYVNLIASKFSYTEDEIIKFISDKNYLNELINNYWFISNDILKKDIYYPLEGYIFPDTYNFSKDASIKDIFKTLIDGLAKKLEPFKEEIQKSNLSVHEILTLASIVELEGAGSSDRAGVAGVFYNRINDGWSLGSDVTTYYAFKKEFDVELAYNLYNTCNPYNTRSNCFTGLPVGPICASSLDSIKATIEPNIEDYYYFVADKNKKTYFMKNYNEFVNKINELKQNGLWFVY